MSEWAIEMMDIEDSGGQGSKLPKAARQVYALMGEEEVNGYRIPPMVTHL